MSVNIPERLSDLVKPETKAFAYLALVRSDGTPHVTPIWFDYDGKYFIFNTQRGRVKDNIMHKHPVVAFVIADPHNPYRYFQITGPIVSETEKGASDGIRDLNMKYQGNRDYPLKPGDVRVIYKVEAQHISPDK